MAGRSESPDDLSLLHDDLRRIQLYDGILTSFDFRSAAILVGAPPQVDRTAWVAEITELAGTFGTGETSITVLGAPAAEALLGEHILEDLGMRPLRSGKPGLAVWAVLIMGVVFAAAFRRPAAVLLPLVEIGACLVIVFGCMGWLGVPVYLTLAVLPVILAAVGAADEIHIFRRYLELRGSSTSIATGHRDLVHRTLDDMAPPVLRTSLTTAIAFLSFALSPIGQPSPGGQRSPREWTSWIEEARLDDDSWVLIMPRQGGSAAFWLRPAAEDEIVWELHKEPFSVPAVLRHVEDLEGFLASSPGAGGVLGPARFLATAGFLLRPDDPGSRRLPESPKGAQARWSNFTTMRGQQRTRQLIDSEGQRGLVTVHLQGSSYRDTRRLLDSLDLWAAEHLPPNGLEIRPAGDVAVSQVLIEAVVTTQIRSLALSLLGIFFFSAWLGRSLAQGFLCVLPPTLAVLLAFAAMGWLGIPLGVATSMFAGMTLGIGVDYAIHLLAHHRRAGARALEGPEALAATLTSAGPAIVIDALAVGLGFGVLMLSEVPANARLGGLLVLSLTTCLAATLLLVPALLAGRNSDSR